MIDIHNFTPYPATGCLDTHIEIWTNLAIGFVASCIAVICVYRMNVLTARHKLVVRLRYLILFVGSLATVMAPWAFPENTRMGSLIFAGALLAHLLLSAVEWKNGAPKYMESQWSRLSVERKCDEQYCNICRDLGQNPNSLWCKLRRCWNVVVYILRGDKRWNLQPGP